MAYWFKMNPKAKACIRLYKLSFFTWCSSEAREFQWQNKCQGKLPITDLDLLSTLFYIILTEWKWPDTDLLSTHHLTLIRGEMTYFKTISHYSDRGEMTYFQHVIWPCLEFGRVLTCGYPVVLSTKEHCDACSVHQCARLSGAKQPNLCALQVKIQRCETNRVKGVSI